MISYVTLLACPFCAQNAATHLGLLLPLLLLCPYLVGWGVLRAVRRISAKETPS